MSAAAGESARGAVGDAGAAIGQLETAIAQSWLLAAFVFDAALERLHRALRPGGWLVVGAGRFADDPLAAAATRWQTVRAGGTPLPVDEAMRILERTGFIDAQELPTPPGAPALYAARLPGGRAL